MRYCRYWDLLICNAYTHHVPYIYMVINKIQQKQQGFAHLLLIAVLAITALGAASIISIKLMSNHNRQAGIETVAGANTSTCTTELTVGANDTYKTIESAINAAGSSTAGKVICVRNNKVYGRTLIDKGGTAASPLVIKSHPQNSARPVFRDDTPYPDWRNRNDDGAQLVTIRASHVIFQGFELARSSATGLSAGGVLKKIGENKYQEIPEENIQIINVSVHDTYGDGIKVLYGKNVLIESCELYRNEMVGTVTDCMKFPNAICSIGEVLKVRHSDTVTVQNCSIREDMSRGRGGILNTDSFNTTYRNNEIYMSDGNYLHIGDASNIVMENNLIFANCGYRVNGLYKLAERYPPTQDPYPWKGGSGYVIRNNLIVGAEKGFNFGGCEGYVAARGKSEKYWTPGHACPFKNVTIENNTVVGIGIQDGKEDEDNERALIIGDMKGNPASNVRIRNNIFHSTDDGKGDGEDLKNALTGDVVFSGNIWHDKNQLTNGDVEIPNLTGVFANNPNLNYCVPVGQKLNPANYRVAEAFAGKGADVSKIGINAASNNPNPDPVPDPVPDPDPTPDPVPQPTGIGPSLLHTNNWQLALNGGQASIEKGDVTFPGGIFKDVADLRITKLNGSNPVFVHQKVTGLNFTPGKKYEVILFAKTITGNPSMALFVSNGTFNPSQNTVTTTAQPVTNSWEPYKFVFTAPQKGENTIIGFMITGKTPSRIRFNAVILDPVD